MSLSPEVSPSPAQQPVIEIRNLTMAYGTFVVQRKLNFSIQPGEVFIIMGDSGCGKSTLLNHLIGLLHPARGDIRYWGESYTQATVERRMEIARRFGVSFQSGALWSSMTLAENIALPLRERSGLSESAIRDLTSLKLATVGLAGFERFYPSEISGGMLKRAGLARAMALDPDILFFDEPSAGLDPISSCRLDELILELRSNLQTTIVVVTHELDSIYAIADNAVFLDGELRTQTALGNPKTLRDNPPNAKVGQFLRRQSGPKPRPGTTSEEGTAG